MAELIDVANAMFRHRNNWKLITNEDKEKYFFIFNRFFSKKYPTKSQFLNIKNIDKSSSMDIWFHFMENKPYPKWFWSKSEKKINGFIDEKDINLLSEKLEIDNFSDIEYLILNFPEIIKEELKFYKSKK
jgi:hypothetical protein